MAFGGLTGHTLVPIVAFFVAGLTAFYMFRLVILTFLGEARGRRPASPHVHESPRIMTVPLMILAALSIFVFYSWNPLDASEGWISKAPASSRHRRA